MEETKNIWNKTSSEITVRDQLVVSAAVIGGLLGASVIINGACLGWAKLQERRNRKHLTEK
jgi:hypothetical protein